MGAPRSILIACAALAAVAACATPGPVPPPAPPAPFVCAGPESVPNFDAVANEVVLAAQVFDDDEALAELDKVAGHQPGGTALVRCVIDEILPDLRAAPVTGVHVQQWEAAHPAGVLP